jgi:RNA polymerase sigma-70 factor, ECF subfamily
VFAEPARRYPLIPWPFGGKLLSDDDSTPAPDDARLRALMAAYQSGSLDAFDELYRSVAPGVRGLLRSLDCQPDRVADLVQDTFLQIHRARRTYDPAYPVMPWALAIARHVWLMDRRSRSRRPQPAVNVDSMDLPVRGEAAGLADRADVRRALAGVAAGRRLPLVLHHVWGLSFREIAARLGIGEAAAKLRSSRGMADLRRVLDPFRHRPRRAHDD